MKQRFGHIIVNLWFLFLFDLGGIQRAGGEGELRKKPLCTRIFPPYPYKMNELDIWTLP